MPNCPKCKDSFETERGMKIHHKRIHNESIAGKAKECVVCEDEFRVKKSDYERRKCCSKDCYSNYLSENRSGKNHPCWQGGDVDTECDECGKSINKKRSEYNRSDHYFCSVECESEWKKKNATGENHPCWEGKSKQECSYCGEIFRDKSSNYLNTKRTFCSMDCFSDWCSNERVREKHPSWKGGYEGYYGPSWKRNRRKVLERDNHNCQSCGTSENLHVHHIMPFRMFGVENHEEANDPNNLITFCEPCHKKWEGIPVAPI